MDLINLKIYPSGFLGSNNVPQTAPRDLQTTARQLFNRANIVKANPYTANLDVLDLWTVATSGENDFKTFEFKEKILKVALRAFGTKTILQWITAQWQSPEVGTTHAKWVDETIEFVFTGKPRQMSVNGWSAILTAGENDEGPDEYTPIVKKYIIGNSAYDSHEFMTIQEFLLMWVRQTNGITDLLQSLQVMFGTRI